jgi:hypothetical protein
VSFPAAGAVAIASNTARFQTVPPANLLAAKSVPA